MVIKGENMAIIYKITNRINGKIYIGETTQSLQDRWKQHRIDYKKEKNYRVALYNAMNKYGINNFTIEAINEVPDEERFEKETEYILSYQSLTYQNGYNIVLFGSGRGLYNIDEVIALWEKGYTEKEISELMQCSDKTIRRFLYANDVSKQDIRKRSAKKYNKKAVSIQQYDESGIFIAEWNSITECIKQNPEFSQSGISLACAKERLSYKHYLWKYSNDSTPIQELVEKNRKKDSSHCYPRQIRQLDPNTRVVIALYDSAEKARIAIQAKDKSNICRAAREGRKAYGYYWEYVDE